MAILQPNIIEILIPGYRSADAAVTFWDIDKEYTVLDTKVTYFSEIYNAILVPVPIGTPPTDTTYYRQITSGSGGGGNLPAGGDLEDVLIKDSPVDGAASWRRGAVSHWNGFIADYLTDQIVSYGSSLYQSLTDNPPAGTLPTDEVYWKDIINEGLIPVAVTIWDELKSDYIVNNKVTYLDSIYNAILSPIPVGILPTDTNYWEDIGAPFSPTITAPEEVGQVIQYDDITGKWVNVKNDAKYVSYTFAARDPFEDYSEDVANMVFKLNIREGGQYMLDYADANVYSPDGLGSLGFDDYTYTEVGTLSSTEGSNENGSYHLSFTQSGAEVFDLNDALYITNTTPIDGERPDDSSQTFVVSGLVSDTEVIVNRFINRFGGGYPDGFKVYKYTYDTLEAKSGCYYEFTGQGLVGYPFPLQVAQPGDIVRAERPFNRTIWTFDRSRDRPNFYGVDIDENTRKRPVDVFRKDPATDDGILNNLFTFIYEGIRQNVPPLSNGNPVQLQNHPVQNVHIVSNQVVYDLAAYPNSYVIKNHSGNSYDFVVLYGGVGDNPSFGNNHPEMMDVCHVTMNDVGVIQSVQDSFWMNDNGGVEVKETTNPEVVIGGEVVDNNLADEFQKRRYTLTDSTIVTSYKESVESVYPDDLSITELWPDNDDRKFSSFTRDGRWYNPDATIPDSREPNAKHELIPFGSFSVDFLYVYQKQGSALDYLIVKGEKLYTAADLVQGAEILPLRPTTTLNGYTPVAALLQYGSGDLGYHNIIDIKGKESGDLVYTTTEEFLKDLSSKTQFRTEQNLLSKLQYNSSLQQGDPQGQGWLVRTSPNNVLAPVSDPDDGSTTLEMTSVDVSNNYISRVFLRTNSVDLYNNGGSDTFRVKPAQGGTSGEHRMRIIALDDPRATKTFFLFPEAYSQVPVVPYAVHNKSTPELVVTSTGEFSFKLERLNIQSVGTLISGLNDKFSLRTLDGANLEFFVNGSSIGSGGSWNLSGLDVGKTITIRRNGIQIQLLVEGIVRASSSSAPDSDDWIVTTLGARDIDGGTTYTDRLHVGGFTDLKIKENSVSTPKIYQMGTLLPVFEPDVPADGDFIIEDYAPYFWKARVSGDYPVWDETKADYTVGEIVRFTVGNYECIQANPPVGGFPSAQPSYWTNVSDIDDQTLYVRWGTNGTDSTVTLVTDAGNTTHTYLGETGYFDIQLQINQTSLNDWGTLNLTTIPPSGIENAQSNDNLVWNFSGFSDLSEISDLRTGNDIDGFSSSRSFYLKNHTLGIFRTPATIPITAEDMILNSIFVAEGNRDWVFVVPPYSTAIDGLNSPNASSVSIKFIGEGSYLIKRPDLSDDVLVNNTESIQGVFSDTALVDITTEDDFTTLMYVNYTVSDITSGAGGLIPPSAPTEAINVSWDNSATGLTATNVQDMGTELALRGGTVDEVVKVTSVAGDVINFSVITIPTDYLTVPSLQLEFNGRTQEKGVDWVRNNSTSIRLPNYNTKATKHTIRLVSYPQ